MNYKQAYQWLHGDRKEYSGCRAAAEAMEAEVQALRKDAERYRKLVASGKYCAASIGGGWGLGGKSTKAQLDAAADALPAVSAA